MFRVPFSVINAFLIVLLGFVAIVGDVAVHHFELKLLKAIFDNATHAIIAGISWFFISINFKNRSSFESLVEVGFCTATASLIDLDHFYAANSLRLDDATSLDHRPPLHCSTVPAVFFAFLLTLGRLIHYNYLQRLAFLIFTAFISHHIRDATRKGFWFYPFGSTPPIPYLLYIILTCLLPIVLGALMSSLNINDVYKIKLTPV